MAPGATDKEVKRAYRQLSLKFHPDKARSHSCGRPCALCPPHACTPPQNPDPAAANYFAEYISPAYKVRGFVLPALCSALTFGFARRSLMRLRKPILKSTGTRMARKVRA